MRLLYLACEVTKSDLFFQYYSIPTVIRTVFMASVTPLSSFSHGRPLGLLFSSLFYSDSLASEPGVFSVKMPYLACVQ